MHALRIFALLKVHHNPVLKLKRHNFELQCFDEELLHIIFQKVGKFGMR